MSFPLFGLVRISSYWMEIIEDVVNVEKKKLMTIPFEWSVVEAVR